MLGLQAIKRLAGKGMRDEAMGHSENLPPSRGRRIAAHGPQPSVARLAAHRRRQLALVHARTPADIQLLRVVVQLLTSAAAGARPRPKPAPAMGRDVADR